jgi:hypothetical protein
VAAKLADFSQGFKRTGEAIMRVTKFVAIAAAMALVFSTTASALVMVPPRAPSHHGFGHAAVWTIFGCSGGIILAAWTANVRQHRQLSLNEAATCGLAYWFNPQAPR